MNGWQAIYDEYPSGRLEFCVIRGEDRSTLVVLSTIDSDDTERLDSATEFGQRMAQACQEAAYRNALDEGDVISTFVEANPAGLVVLEIVDCQVKSEART